MRVRVRVRIRVRAGFDLTHLLEEATEAAAALWVLADSVLGLSRPLQGRGGWGRVRSHQGVRRLWV